MYLNKANALLRLKKLTETIEKFPDDVTIANAELNYAIGYGVHIRVDSEDNELLNKIADANEWYCKKIRDEYDTHDGVHALDENGVEVVQMVKRHD